MPMSRVLLGGMFAGVCVSFVEGPVDLFKTKMQVQVKDAHGNLPYRSTFHCATQVRFSFLFFLLSSSSFILLISSYFCLHFLLIVVYIFCYFHVNKKKYLQKKLQIIKQYGLGGVYQGFIATQARNIISNALYFAVYEYLKRSVILFLLILFLSKSKYYLLLFMLLLLLMLFIFITNYHWKYYFIILLFILLFIIY